VGDSGSAENDPGRRLVIRTVNQGCRRMDSDQSMHRGIQEMRNHSRSGGVRCGLGSDC
jgi:hypothetical protein